jgi:hypothetical protein
MPSASAAIAIAMLGWLVALLQVPAAVGCRWKRVPLLVFTGLAIAATMDLPAVMMAVDHGTRVADLATLIKHLCSAISCCALLDWVITLERPRPGRWHLRHWQACLAVLITMVVLFSLAPRAETTSFTRTQTASMVTAYLLVYQGFFGAASAVAARQFWQGARNALPGTLRQGIWLLTAGATLGAVYGLAEVVILTTRATGSEFPGGTDRALTVASRLVPLAAGLILASMLAPPAFHALRAARRLGTYRSLHPLWRSLTAEAPAIVLRPPSHRLGMPAGLEIRMIRRVAEIRDGILLMRRRVGPATLAQAREMLSGYGLRGTTLDAAAEACAVELGLHMPRNAAPAPAVAVEATPAPGGSDLADEITWLRTVASARRSPAVQRVTGTLATTAASTAVGASPRVTSLGGPRDYG